MSNTAKLHAHPEPLNKDERKYQTELIMQLFAHWNLSIRQQAIALGLSSGTGTSIHNYKSGKGYLPTSRDIQDRIGHLLAIHKCLRRAYPFNNALVYSWIKTPNSDFNQQTPFDIMEQQGLLGVVEIRNYLEQGLQ
jgi:hypothetical protein